MTDYKQLCAELLETIDLLTEGDSRPESAAISSARALLAQPVAEGVSADEWDALVERAWDKYKTVGYLGELFMYDSDFGNALNFVRKELAPWGNSQAILDSSPQPVPVSERLPEPSVKVLAHYFNALGKGRTICAIWVPAKSRSDEGELDSDDFLEYDEESDKYYWPEGWYEAIENWEELGWAKVYEGEIAYWQPLPQWPVNALPTHEALDD